MPPQTISEGYDFESSKAKRQNVPGMTSRAARQRAKNGMACLQEQQGKALGRKGHDFESSKAKRQEVKGMISSSKARRQDVKSRA